MTVVVENGTGVAGANSYATAVAVSAYLAARNRSTENGWTGGGGEGAEEDAAVIEATAYIESRFGNLFMGSRYWSDISGAKATLQFTGQPTATETVVLGSTTYTFRAALAGANDVLIGDTLRDSVLNLIDAIKATPGTSGTAYHASTVENPDATAAFVIDDAVVAYAKATGTSGNAVTSTTTVSAASWNGATLFGGSETAYAQPLSFPRLSLFDRSGNRILWIPQPLLEAHSEYAVRARLSTTTLAPDPTVDAYGGTVEVLREKVGPIESETRYVSGTTGSGRLPAYPAADRLLFPYVSSRRVVRG